MFSKLEIRSPAALLWFWPALVAAVLAVFLSPRHAQSQAQPQLLVRRRQSSGPVRPSPEAAPSDVPAPLHEGCMIGKVGTESGTCLYGDPHGRRSLVLFGDSHALQHFPALQVVAKRNHWRLYVLTKRECTPAAVTVHSSAVAGKYSTCDAWRENTLKRIEAIGGRTAVALSDLTSYRAFDAAGAELRGRVNANALEAGYVATLRRLRRAGVGAVVIRDTPEAPTDVPSCVAANIGDPRACAFPEPHRWDRNFDLRAARKVGVPVISLWPKICSHGLCRAVVNGILVYRDNAHITATFSRSLSRWFEPGLKKAFAAAR